MPTYAATEAFRRAFQRLPHNKRQAFNEMRRLFLAELKAHGFTPPLHPSLRVHKLSGHDVWLISFGDGMRAVFRLGSPVKEGEVHIVWEFIGTHDEYTRTY